MNSITALMLASDDNIYKYLFSSRWLDANEFFINHEEFLVGAMNNAECGRISKNMSFRKDSNGNEWMKKVLGMPALEHCLLHQNSQNAANGNVDHINCVIVELRNRRNAVSLLSKVAC